MVALLTVSDSALHADEFVRNAVRSNSALSGRRVYLQHKLSGGINDGSDKLIETV